MNESDYRSIFPDSELRADSQAAGRWETNHGGEYFAAGVGGSITGRGADLLIIDDPHSEQDALSKTAMENAWEWYTSGPRQRLQPGGSIVVVMTRWSEDDLTERLIEAQSKDDNADKWEIVDFPAIMDDGQPQWPEFWKIDQLKSVKASLPVAKWNAQWQQQPTSEETSIIKREWWQCWDKPQPPLQYIIQSYDTAFSSKTTADFSAITTWGVFYNEITGKQNIILMEADKGRWDFPELKRIALEKNDYWQPEQIIIEAKATGLPLTHELQAMGIPVINFTPSRGNDKLVRVNSVAPLFESGMIWYPPYKWAEEVIEECAAFPYGRNDDLVDSTTQALMRYRQFGALQHEYDEEIENRPKRRIAFYGS
jgi:predicted phage terminase large subunit-like protein